MAANYSRNPPTLSSLAEAQAAMDALMVQPDITRSDVEKSNQFSEQVQDRNMPTSPESGLEEGQATRSSIQTKHGTLRLQGRTVNQTLEWIFENNGSTAKASDDLISKAMALRFPHNVAHKHNEIAIRRKHFNEGTGEWRGGKVRSGEELSVQYYPCRSQRIPYNDSDQSTKETVKPTDFAAITEQQVNDIAARIAKQIVLGELGQVDAKLHNRIVAHTATDGHVQLSTIQSLIAEAITNRPNYVIHVADNTPVTFDHDQVHKSFAETMMKVSAGVPVLLVGPAGSGKTHLASQIAKALSRPFSFNSMSAGISESQLLGRTIPDKEGNWTYHASPFVHAWQNGGVHLLDEMDAADPNLMVQINAALANGLLSIPFADTAPIVKHPNTLIIAAANTFGNGADRMYVGRNQLDAATLNRFTMGTVEITYDEDLERNLTTGILGGALSSVEELLKWSWRMRGAITANKLRRIMSTRNIKDAASLLRAGGTMTLVKDTYFMGWSDDEKKRVNSNS